MRRVLLGVLTALLSACPSSPQSPAGASGKAASDSSPADAPSAYTVLLDQTDPAANRVEYHVLMAPPTHRQLDATLKFLYRHLQTRTETPPSRMGAYVYSNKSQYETPPRSPIGSVIQDTGQLGPVFDIKIPLDFDEQVAEALPPDSLHKSMGRMVVLDEPDKGVTITHPYAEDGSDVWVAKLSFTLAMTVFLNAAQAAFDKVPDLRTLHFVGRWVEPCKTPPCGVKDVIDAHLDRATYASLGMGKIEEQIGQIHGRSFTELASEHDSDAHVMRAHQAAIAAVYRGVIKQMGSRIVVSPSLK